MLFVRRGPRATMDGTLKLQHPRNGFLFFGRNTEVRGHRLERRMRCADGAWGFSSPRSPARGQVVLGCGESAAKGGECRDRD